MSDQRRKQTMKLSLRIFLTLAVALFILGLAGYYLLSKTFHSDLTSYTIDIVEAMVHQGVSAVENELQIGLSEAVLLADSLDVTEQEGETVLAAGFPSPPGGETKLFRMRFVTEAGTTSSDGRSDDLFGRSDIAAAFEKTPSIYGPYFNEDGEFVITYSAPVIRDEKVVGVLCVEKDGFRFSELIQDIQFANSGESYIIDAAGTDIAVSDETHMDWVTSRYNASELSEAQLDPDAASVLELEKLGLAGQSGVGTYNWRGSLCYVIYEPIPTTKWVMLAGLREEEIASITRTTIFSALLKNSTPLIVFIVLVLFVGLIVYWILSNMKQSIAINKNLESMANHDALTGLLNRRYLETSLEARWKYPLSVSCEACVFMMDIDNFKNYNDCYGHLQGDICLKRIAGSFRDLFDGYGGEVIRYGGEEFVAVIFEINREKAEELADHICRAAEEEGIPNGNGGVVTVSVGACYVENTSKAPFMECIAHADRALYQAKKNGKNRAEFMNIMLQS